MDQSGDPQPRLPAAPARPAYRIGPSLALVVLVTFLLAAVAVLVRTRLATDLAEARGASANAALPAPSAALIALVDGQRERTGCGALRVDAELTASAQGHAADMASRGYVSQTAPNGGAAQQRATAAGYSGAVVEVLAAGIPAAAQVFAQWTNPDDPASAAVVAKLTDCAWASAGVGYSAGRAMPTFGPGIWVLDLGDR